MKTKIKNISSNQIEVSISSNKAIKIMVIAPGGYVIIYNFEHTPGTKILITRKVLELSNLNDDIIIEKTEIKHDPITKVHIIDKAENKPPLEDETKEYFEEESILLTKEEIDNIESLENSKKKERIQIKIE